MIAEAGAQTIVADIDEARAETVVNEIRDDGYEAAGVCANAFEAASVDKMIESTKSTYGRLDILVNVVGGMSAFLAWLKTAELGDADFDFMIQLNLRSVFLTCRAAIRQFIAQGTGGVIVNTSSISALQSAPRHAAYGAAKAGVMSLTRTLAAEYGPSGVRVNAIAPGSITTSPQAPDALIALIDAEAHTRSDIGIEQARITRSQTADVIPLRRNGTPLDIARAALFLASDLSGYITGQTIIVDGGASIRWDLGQEPGVPEPL
jgi:3-oxoacyl-[acyl-carrier protein] reductase